MENKDIEFLDNYELSLTEELLRVCTSLGMLDGTLLSSEDIDGKWKEFAPEYMSEAVPNLDSFPEAAIGWAGYIGMAVTKWWDIDWGKHHSEKSTISYRIFWDSASARQRPASSQGHYLPAPSMLSPASDTKALKDRHPWHSISLPAPPVRCSASGRPSSLKKTVTDSTRSSSPPPPGKRSRCHDGWRMKQKNFTALHEQIPDIVA